MRRDDSRQTRHATPSPASASWENLTKQCIDLGLHRDPTMASALACLEFDPTDRQALEFVAEQIAVAERIQLITPDAFRATAPTQFDDVDGDIVLGMTSNNTVYGINRDALCRHMLTAGSSGSGKTSLLKILVAQLINRSS